ncbi:MAG: HNH endonuclease [Deltaproteobacteria bacterium]|nr:HNH endonuclease [Deltaproteobacteria bacterium]
MGQKKWFTKDRMEKLFKDKGVEHHDDKLVSFLKNAWYRMNKKTGKNCFGKKEFVLWYLEEASKGCYYCELEQGGVEEVYGHLFREGRRGKFLEIDRKKPKGKYTESNCVVACYPCNNAKSDIFDAEVFKDNIGEAVKKWIAEKRRN